MGYYGTEREICQIFYHLCTVPTATHAIHQDGRGGRCGEVDARGDQPRQDAHWSRLSQDGKVCSIRDRSGRDEHSGQACERQFVRHGPIHLQAQNQELGQTRALQDACQADASEDDTDKP